MDFLERVCPMFLDGIPTVNRWCVGAHDNRVLCVERGQGSGIAVDESIVEFFIKRETLLTPLWIWCVCLGKGWQSKADGQPCKNNNERISLFPPEGFRTVHRAD